MAPEVGAAAAGRRGPPPGADRRGRLRRQPLLRRAPAAAAQGRSTARARHLHRHVLQDPVPRAAAGLARGAAARSSSGCRRPSSWPTCTRAPLHPGGGAPLLRAAAARPPRQRAWPRSTARRRALLLGVAAAAHAGRGDVDGAAGRLLAAAHAARRAGRGGAAAARRSSAAWPSRRGRRSSSTAAASGRCGCRSRRCRPARIDEGVQRLAEAIKDGAAAAAAGDGAERELVSRSSEPSLQPKGESTWTS